MTKAVVAGIAAAMGIVEGTHGGVFVIVVDLFVGESIITRLVLRESGVFAARIPKVEDFLMMLTVKIFTLGITAGWIRNGRMLQ
jgi:hypothetical protein